MKHEKQQSVLFTAELQHSEETFYRLARVQAQLYGALGKVFVIFCGFALIAAALFALQESTGRLVLLFFWLLDHQLLGASGKADSGTPCACSKREFSAYGLQILRRYAVCDGI